MWHEARVQMAVCSWFVINSIIELLGIPMQCRGAQVKAYKREQKRIKAGRDQARGSHGPPLVSINTVVRNAPLFVFQNSFIPPHGRSSPAHLCSNGRARLYSTSRASPATTTTLTTAVTAGEEADDDAAEADNAGDDGLEDASDARDDSHDAVADSSEHAGDL